MDMKSLLQQDHAEVRDLLRKMVSRPDPAQESLRGMQQTVNDLLLNHARMEERFLYARLVEENEALRLTSRSYDDHNQIEKLLLELNTQRMGSEAWVDLCQQILDCVEAHVQREEQEMLPLAEQLLAPGELEEIYRRMIDFRKHYMLVSPDLPVEPLS